ncbi:MAG: 4Fe-4S dicluster domain-containing protein [Candidatus Hodarchaeales archaeon]
MNNKLIEAVKNAGVVGAGGAGFPTHIKLTASNVDTYIVNGAECDPLLRIDQQILACFPEKVVRGLQLGMEATGASRGIIAIKKKYTKAIKVIQKVISEDNRLEIFQLDDSYPAGDEFVLVYEILDKLIPERGLPLQVGALVNNVVTIVNIAEAYDGKPVTSKYVTVTGIVQNPQTINVPIGTSIETVIEAAGGVIEKPFKIIEGGPMMGFVVSPLTPVRKTTSGIIVLPEDHYLIRLKDQTMAMKVVITKAACIRCQLCTEVCPRYLLGHDIYPDKVMRAVAFGHKEKHGHLTSSFLCVDCAVCTIYGCPMGLDPCKVMGEVAQQLTQEGLSNPHKRTTLQIHPEREYRKIPMKRLISRLRLTDYDQPAPISLKKELKPKMVKIPLKQHIGDPAVPIVSIGDRVSKGDLIGKIPDGSSVGATIHASISGIVEQITEEIIIKSKKN